MGLTGFRHLGGDGAFPDQVVQVQFSTAQTCFLGRAEGGARRTDGFVGFLGSFALGGVLPGLRTEVVGAILLFHTTTGGSDRLLRQMHRVRSHVGDISLLVEALSRSHRIPSRQAQLAV